MADQSPWGDSAIAGAGSWGAPQRPNLDNPNPPSWNTNPPNSLQPYDPGRNGGGSGGGALPSWVNPPGLSTPTQPGGWGGGYGGGWGGPYRQPTQGTGFNPGFTTGTWYGDVPGTPGRDPNLPGYNPPRDPRQGPSPYLQPGGPIRPIRQHQPQKGYQQPYNGPMWTTGDGPGSGINPYPKTPWNTGPTGPTGFNNGPIGPYSMTNTPYYNSNYPELQAQYGMNQLNTAAPNDIYTPQQSAGGVNPYASNPASAGAAQTGSPYDVPQAAQVSNIDQWIAAHPGQTHPDFLAASQSRGVAGQRLQQAETDYRQSVGNDPTKLVDQEGNPGKPGMNPAWLMSPQEYQRVKGALNPHFNASDASQTRAGDTYLAPGANPANPASYGGAPPGMANIWASQIQRHRPYGGY